MQSGIEEQFRMQTPEKEPPPEIERAIQNTKNQRPLDQT